MSTTFPRARKLGYDVDQVEDFLEDARRAYHAQPGEMTLVTAESIRQQAFLMRKRGYSPTHVDAALERLEDAFAVKERDSAFRTAGDQAWYAQARGMAQVILDRVVRPRGRRFKRVGLFTMGYAVRDVDMLLFGAKDGHHLPATEMLPYRADGTLLSDPKVVFDAERNWTVVRAILGAPGPGVANIFLYAPLRDLLLDHARAIGEPESLIELAATVISQPSDSALHNDHMHVRIYCPRGEPTCRDYAIRLAAKKPRPAGPFLTLASVIGKKPITGGLLRARPRW